MRKSFRIAKQNRGDPLWGPHSALPRPIYQATCSSERLVQLCLKSRVELALQILTEGVACARSPRRGHWSRTIRRLRRTAAQHVYIRIPGIVQQAAAAGACPAAGEPAWRLLARAVQAVPCTLSGMMAMCGCEAALRSLHAVVSGCSSGHTGAWCNRYTTVHVHHL